MDWETAVRIIMKAAEGCTTDKAAYLKVGYSCNNSCRFCTARWKKNNPDRTTLELKKEISLLAKDTTNGTLIYSGGEPTLRNDLSEVVQFSKSLGITQQIIQTNGSGIADFNYAYLLKNSGVTSCFVSIHSPYSRVHNFLTGNNYSFVKVSNGIKNLMKIGIPFSTNTVICKQNTKFLEQLIIFLKAKFPLLKKAKLSYPNLQGGAADNLKSIVSPIWEVAPHIQNAIEKGEEVGLYIDTEFVPPCYLSTRLDRVSEIAVQRYDVLDIAFRIPDWDHKNRRSNQVFYEECKKCGLNGICCGFHKLHHKYFGSPSNLSPII